MLSKESIFAADTEKKQTGELLTVNGFACKVADICH
jgi:hypothetical protein